MGYDWDGGESFQTHLLLFLFKKDMKFKSN